MMAIQRYRNCGSDSAVNREVGFLPCTNRFIEKDIARIIGDAIRDGIAFLIKRANEIESVIDGFVVVGLVRVCPAGGCTNKRIYVQGCTLAADSATVSIGELTTRNHLHGLISHAA
tara:strand:- start:2131 stop:2478 length:348 start_codon:yes stop_codon:yes gene_type:complete